MLLLSYCYERTRILLSMLQACSPCPGDPGKDRTRARSGRLIYPNDENRMYRS